jgi:protein involved in temperature-dependent protein secretion
MMVSANEFHAANKRALQRMAKAVRAVSAKYDRRIGMVVVQLSSGLYLQFRPRDIQGMEYARPSDLREIVISPSGQGLYVPALDADVYVPGLLRGVLGSRSWMKSLAFRADR